MSLAAMLRRGRLQRAMQQELQPFGAAYDWQTSMDDFLQEIEGPLQHQASGSLDVLLHRHVGSFGENHGDDDNDKDDEDQPRQ